jgi:hypothetical protein
MCTPLEESVRNKLKRRGYAASKRRGEITFSLTGGGIELKSVSVDGLQAIISFIDAKGKK